MLIQFKILLVPTIILIISYAGRILGPKVSGLLGGLPIILGPIILFLKIEKGDVFAISTAKNSILGISSLAIFCLSYALLCRKKNITFCLISSILLFLISTFCLSLINPNLFYGILLSLTIITLALTFSPKPSKEPTKTPISNKELLYRILAATFMVYILTMLADFLGPKLSGLLAPFPIAGSILCYFTHLNYGADATIKIIKGFLTGLYGMLAFLSTICLFTNSLGFEISISIGVILAIFSSWIANQIIIKLSSLR
jgi:hypothetical protein